MQDMQNDTSHHTNALPEEANPLDQERLTWENEVKQVAKENALKEDRIRVGWDATDERMPAFAYRWEHVQQVTSYGRWLLTQIDADADIVIAACWLHDSKKLEPHHAQRGAQFARDFLPTTDFPTAKIEAVAFAIEQHEGLFRAENRKKSREIPFIAAAPIEPIEAALLWDADKLSKVGPTALIHSYSAHLLGLHRANKSITTQEFILNNREWLDKFVPRIIASLNTLAAQKKAKELYASYDLFWRRAEETIALYDPIDHIK